MNDIVKRTSENDGKIYHDNARLASENERIANEPGLKASTAMRHLEQAARHWAAAADASLRRGVETYAHKRFDTVLNQLKRLGGAAKVRELKLIKPRV